MKSLKVLLLLATAAAFSATTAMADIYSDPPGNNNDDASVTGPANTETPDSDAVNVDPEGTVPPFIDGGSAIDHDDPTIEIVPPAPVEQ